MNALNELVACRRWMGFDSSLLLWSFMPRWFITGLSAQYLGNVIAFGFRTFREFI